MWDKGSHTLDMTLFAAGIDLWPKPGVTVTSVSRDREEPSNHFRASFAVGAAEGRVELSRTEALPNMISICGTRGEVWFSVGPRIDFG